MSDTSEDSRLPFHFRAPLATRPMKEYWESAGRLGDWLILVDLLWALEASRAEEVHGSIGYIMDPNWRNLQSRLQGDPMWWERRGVPGV